MRETVLYVARPGLGALPDGARVAIGLAIPQALMCAAFLWAVWTPWPRGQAMWAFDITLTLLLCGLGAALFWRITRGQAGLAIGILRAPFLRLTVTDRRIAWTLPWARAPLMEVPADRVRGGILGDTDRRGRGAAAIILTPGDPAGDLEGRIHLDRLADAAGFVTALGRMA